MDAESTLIGPRIREALGAIVAASSGLDLKLKLTDGTKMKLRMNNGRGVGGAFAKLATASNFQTEGVAALVEWVCRNALNGK